MSLGARPVPLFVAQRTDTSSNVASSARSSSLFGACWCSRAAVGMSGSPKGWYWTATCPVGGPCVKQAFKRAQCGSWVGTDRVCLHCLLASGGRACRVGTDRACSQASVRPNCKRVIMVLRRVFVCLSATRPCCLQPTDSNFHKLTTLLRSKSVAVQRQPASLHLHAIQCFSRISSSMGD